MATLFRYFFISSGCVIYFLESYPRSLLPVLSLKSIYFADQSFRHHACCAEVFANDIDLPLGDSSDISPESDACRLDSIVSCIRIRRKMHDGDARARSRMVMTTTYCNAKMTIKILNRDSMLNWSYVCDACI